MTKNQCKNKITRLEDKIGEMQEQVIHYKRQVKVLDAEDSRKLLDKYHIESEELAELIMQRTRDVKDRSVAAGDNPDKIKPATKRKPAVTETAQSNVQTISQPEKAEEISVTPSSEPVHVNPLDMFR